MAHQASLHRPDLIERSLTAAADFLEGIAARYQHFRIMNAALTELRGLSMTELADLGLNPSMLRSIAKETADKHMAQ